MRKRYVAAGLLLVVVLLVLHFVPVGRTSGYAKRSEQGGITCIYVESNRNFRLVLGQRQAYEAVRNAPADSGAACGVDVVHAKLFVL